MSGVVLSPETIYALGGGLGVLGFSGAAGAYVAYKYFNRRINNNGNGGYNGPERRTYVQTEICELKHANLSETMREIKEDVKELKKELLK